MPGNMESPESIFKGKRATNSMGMSGNVSDGQLNAGLRTYTKNNVIQYVVSLVIILVGIVVALFFNANTSIEIGSIVHGDTSVSSIRITLGPLLVLVGTIALIFAFKYNSFEMRR